jgi:hypothetical protein
LLALAALLALAVGGVMTAHARTVGEFIRRRPHRG